MNRLTILLCGIVALGLAASTSSHVAAQARATGVVSGTIRNGSAGATLPTLSVQLIVISRTSAVTSLVATAEGGRFRFEVPADATVTYLLRTEYQGVPYFDPVPILLSPEANIVARELMVYEVTRERPAQRITSTIVSVRGIDPEAARLHLQRRDVVVTAGDRVYLGGADGVTLRVPAPEGILGVAEDQGIDGLAAVDGQTVTSTQPLRPGESVVVTSLVVGYDPAVDVYRVRVVAPLPTERLEVWVPERFGGTVEPGAGAARAASREADDERWTVVERRGAAPEGESLVVTMRGLSGRNAPNPLVERRGAAVAVLLALAVIAGGVTAVARLRRPGAEASPSGTHSA